MFFSVRFFFKYNKMERNNYEQMTVPGLKNLARERELTRYSRLRKSELIRRLREQSILEWDNDAAMTNVPFLTPTPYTPPPSTPTPTPPSNTIKDLIKYLDNVKEIPKHVSPNLKKLKKKIDDIYKKTKIFEVKESDSALRNFANVYTIDGKDGFDPQSFMDGAHENMTELLRNNRNTKVKLILKCYMISETDNLIRDFPFHSNIAVNVEGTDENDIYIIMTDTILERIANLINGSSGGGSGWVFYKIIKLELHTVSYRPLRGNTWIPLPKELADKKAIINMKNKDNKCFMWCVQRALNPKNDNAERVDKELMEKENTLNMEGIEYPISLKDINKIEKQNPEISITVLGFNEKDKVHPLRVSEYVYNREHNIILLLIERNGVNHYCLVKNSSRLLSKQISAHKKGTHICYRCLNPFWTHKSLEKHWEHCHNHEAVKINMPEKGTMLRFKHHELSEKVPFVIYADTEALIKPIHNCEPNPESSYTKKYQKHEPISFSCYIRSFDDNVYKSKLRKYTGEDAMEKFVEWIEEDVKEIANIPDVEMIFGPNELDQFNDATKCWICNEEFDDTADEKGYRKNEKVKDHCHYTGRFRGAAHNSCNLKYKKPNFIPVIFHNLSGYDSHLFIKNLGYTDGNIDCIPNNEEKYISFTKNTVTGSYTNKEGKTKPIKHKIRFIDSFKFMSTSLDSLVNNLPDDAFNNLKKYYKEEKLSLVRRKGVYPYEYMDSLERFKENKLPPKEVFYSRLTGEGISDEDYEHAEKVWKVFGMKTLQDYHDLYNVTDVLLLADVFENFRNICMENYNLDPAHYFTAPGLAWDACLKITGVELELLSDIDMLLMIEEGIRGGVSMISNRYGKANNKYMGESFNEKEPSKYIQYLDANNLYGWAMSKPLPTHGFEWMKVDELETWELHSCILEVDLEYPKSLHDLHNDYPLAPEQIMVNKISKLIPNLGNKKKYKLHYENLKQYLRLGLKLTHIHRGIKFKESPWLEKYISLNTKLRTEAKNEFEKDFFKLMNNAVFGKTMENIRNRVDIKLVNNKKQAEKLSAKPNFKHCNIFSEDLVAIHMKKTKLDFDKPVYLGMCILDLSKTLMYDFHYNYIKQKYEDKAKLLLTDTDSLMYEIQTEDFYKDINGDVKDRFDTSGYPPDHPSGIPSGFNKKVLGMFKDEVNGNVIDEFVGLRAKLYSYKMFEGEESKKCKGVKKSVVKKSITHEDYKKCLTDQKPQLRKMNVIRSYKHNVFTEEVNKVALSANDDKRYILEDGINTLALGHYKIL